MRRQLPHLAQRTESRVRSATRTSSSALARCNCSSAWRRLEISLKAITAPRTWPPSMIW
jgi:hypothetical protein